MKLKSVNHNILDRNNTPIHIYCEMARQSNMYTVETVKEKVYGRSRPVDLMRLNIQSSVRNPIL